MEKGWMGLHHGQSLSRRHVCGVTSRSHPARSPASRGQGFYPRRGLDKKRLVYAERHDEIELAVAREKLLKNWRREWKFALIEAENPDWRDLWEKWFHSNGPLNPNAEDQPSPVSSTGRRCDM
jgi:putative endonuclease